MKRVIMQGLFVFLDIVIIIVSFMLSLMLRFEGDVPAVLIRDSFLFSVCMLLLCSPLFYILGLYKSLWRYASIHEILKVFGAVLVAWIAGFIIANIAYVKIPDSVFMISFLICFFLVASIRLGYRALRFILITYKPLSNNLKKNVLIIGAGSAGVMVLRELRELKNQGYIIKGFIDDDEWKHRKKINGVTVLGGRNKIPEIIKKYGIKEIIFAIPSMNKCETTEILDKCKDTGCKLKIFPGVLSSIDGLSQKLKIRDVSVEDLLGREEAELDIEKIADYLYNKVVLVTGGGGSIGSELIRQIVPFKPRQILIFDIFENGAYDLQQEIVRRYGNTVEIKVLIGSIREKERVEKIIKKYKPDVVFHAAAHKHVPLMEECPGEAVKNNVIGTLNVAQCAHMHGVKKFVLISTDKAVNPTNVMGATKRLAEMIIQSIDKISKTEFVAVRFGNVLGSNGSVVPLFKAQIEEGGPVTVTDKNITRFFMTIPEAARLVIQAGAMAKKGQIFILDMGQPVKIDDLARDMIRLSGYKPDVDIKIEYVGLRPGEKLYEELILNEEGVLETLHKSIFVGKAIDINYKQLLSEIKMLENCVELDDDELIRSTLAKIVPTYRYSRTYVSVESDVSSVESGRNGREDLELDQNIINDVVAAR